MLALSSSQPLVIREGRMEGRRDGEKEGQDHGPSVQGGELKTEDE